MCLGITVYTTLESGLSLTNPQLASVFQIVCVAGSTSFVGFAIRLTQNQIGRRDKVYLRTY